MQRSPSSSPHPLVALLGPTNTGKTHQAVERMLEWDTGMIGLPLRLLAREVYDRVTANVGEQTVALVTGEEKRIPARPRFWVCTVEAMPVEHDVDFLAVDEIQLAAHRRRGHVFTDRLLHARGVHETWFMGAETMRPLVERLLPTAHIKTSPRFSQLKCSGSRSLAGLPARSAVVAFSAAQVYELAEKVRERRGGAAVVLGALSPTTRNAQVALYQSGEVDVIVATDAIGMGLNMNVDHVAFAATKKYDGKETRRLVPAELAQIAGRAGRHMNDGTFGTLAPLAPLSERVSLAIENHRFPAETRLVWRNSDLDTSSLSSLMQSLGRRPPRPDLALVEYSEDHAALNYLAGQPEIRAAADSAAAVSLLWEVCQIPDFGGHLVEHHARLLAEVFRQLAGPRECLAPDWIEQNVRRIDETEGDLHTLLMRLELVRTWTYITHHARWVRGAKQWQSRTEAIEQRLSDALHTQLVQRFVQRPAGSVVRSHKRARRSRGEPPSAPPRPDGPFSRLLDLHLSLAADVVQPEPDPTRLARELADAPHDRFGVDAAGTIVADEVVVARLTKGADLLHPEVKLVVAEEAGAGARSQLLRRLVAWSRDMVGELLAPLRQPLAEDLSPAGRGLVYQLEQGLGTTGAWTARDQIQNLTQRDRDVLARLDVNVGRRVIYVRGLLKPHRVRQRMALCAALLGNEAAPRPSGTSLVSLSVDSAVSAATYLAVGYPTFGPRAIRADLAERAHQRLSSLARRGPFELPRELAAWLGCPARELPPVLEGFGYQRNRDGLYLRIRRPRRRQPREPRPTAASGRTDARQRSSRSDDGADRRVR